MPIGSIGVRDIILVIHGILDKIGEASRLPGLREFAEDNQFYQNLFPEYKALEPENQDVPMEEVQVRPGMEQSFFEAQHPTTRRFHTLKGVIRALLS